MWSIGYRVVGPSSAWTDEGLRGLREHADRWRGRFSRLASGYELSGLPAGGALVGSLRPGPGRDAARDYLALARALLELEGLFPGLHSFVWDPLFVRRPARPGEIDLAGLRLEILRELDPGESDEDRALDESLARGRAAYREWMVASYLGERLEGARRDFLLWKGAQGGEDPLDPPPAGEEDPEEG